MRKANKNLQVIIKAGVTYRNITVREERVVNTEEAHTIDCDKVRLETGVT